MIKFNIKNLLQAKNENNPYAALRKLGISDKVATTLLNDKRDTISKEHINLICNHYFCTINDLFIWSPDSKAQDVPNHPMQKFRNPNIPAVGYALRKLTVDELFNLNDVAEDMIKKREKKG